MLALIAIAIALMGSAAAQTTGCGSGLVNNCQLTKLNGVDTYCCGAIITSGSGVRSCSSNNLNGSSGPFSDSNCTVPMGNTPSSSCPCSSSSTTPLASGGSLTLYCCSGGISVSTKNGAITSATCPASAGGPFTDATCKTTYSVPSSPPPNAAVSSPPTVFVVYPPPPPVVPSITCNQFVKVQTPQTNQSSFGPYQPSKILYNVCYSVTTLQYGSYNNGYQTTSLSYYKADMGGFPYTGGVNITQNYTLNNITTQTECTTTLTAALNAWKSACACPALIPSCTCSYQAVCCVNNNCNLPLYFSGASKMAISSILLLISLIAAISAGVF